MKITYRKRCFAIEMLAATWLGVTTICSSVEPARAATVFSLTGTFEDSSTVSGTLTIDVVAGLIVGANLSYLGSTYSTLLSQGPFSGDTAPGQTPVPVSYVVRVGASAALTPRIDVAMLGTSAVDSLVSYAGGGICDVDDPCGPDQMGLHWASAYFSTPSNFISVQAGELTATPLPAALPLFVTGLGALGLLGWRRKRKAAAVLPITFALLLSIATDPVKASTFTYSFNNLANIGGGTVTGTIILNATDTAALSYGRACA